MSAHAPSSASWPLSAATTAMLREEPGALTFADFETLGEFDGSFDAAVDAGGGDGGGGDGGGGGD